ncbi:fibronectin type III domain-containing protein [Desulfobacterales bacterium HSG16]|nr:fibronectin type III domain-containing protein [Desulfobacterales bacterium HSG16]
MYPLKNLGGLSYHMCKFLSTIRCLFFKTSISAAILLFSLFFLAGSPAFGAFVCSDIPQAECDALDEFYTITNGPNWTIKTGWGTTSACSTWKGVTVTDGHVTDLKLSTNNLSGNITSINKINNLTELTYISLANNQLSGQFPTLNLSKLVTLYIHTNQLTGTIPNLSGCPNLEQLTLGVNAIEGDLSNIQNLVKLTYLGLQGNKITGSLSFLGELTSLTFVNLTGNDLTDLSLKLNDFSLLETFNININRIECVLSPYQLPKLIWKDFSYNKISPSDPSDSDLKKLININTQTIPPTNVQATDVTATSAKITWDIPPYDTTIENKYGEYNIKYSTTSPTTGPWTIAASTSNKNETESIITLAPGNTYYVVVETHTPTIEGNHDLISSTKGYATVKTPSLPVLGDVDHLNDVNLTDAILVLKILAGIGIDPGTTTIYLDADVDGNDKLGLEDLIYILRKLAGLPLP